MFQTSDICLDVSHNFALFVTPFLYLIKFPRPFIVLGALSSSTSSRRRGVAVGVVCFVRPLGRT